MIRHPAESRFTKPRPDCPHPERWSSADADATEYEVLDFMWGLVRGTQPSVVLETGTHLGYMAKRIGQALALNGHGTLHSYEPEPTRYKSATDLVNSALLRTRSKDGTFHNHVVLHPEPSMVPWLYGQIDLAWFDSLLHLREAEFNFYLEHMTTNTVVCFHDAGPHHGKWSDSLRSHPRLQAFDMPTPRGLLVGRVK